MIVVADTSAISNLMAIGREGILRDLFGQVLVPPAVERELLDWHRDLPAFVVVEQPCDMEAIFRLSLILDPGESEAIALAIQVRADLLLIDERKGRSAAVGLGLKTTGLLGVLLEAKAVGLLEKLEPLLDDLISTAEFHVSAKVMAECLRLAGEDGTQRDAVEA
jgi:predicted nucleic acid-binding protein